jgi:hypothetical protein
LRPEIPVHPCDQDQFRVGSWKTHLDLGLNERFRSLRDNTLPLASNIAKCVYTFSVDVASQTKFKEQNA